MNPLRLQVLALAASLGHVLVDFQIGLFAGGTPLLQGANIVVTSLLYALWSWALGAAALSRSAVASLVMLAAAWAGLGQGAIGLAVCPPPCGGSPGLQDAAHLASLVFGSWAAFATARALGESAGAISWWPSVFALALTVSAFALQGMLAMR